MRLATRRAASGLSARILLTRFRYSRLSVSDQTIGFTGLSLRPVQQTIKLLRHALVRDHPTVPHVIERALDSFDRCEFLSNEALHGLTGHDLGGAAGLRGQACQSAFRRRRQIQL